MDRVGELVTGILALDWTVLALSLFNAILMLWLGLTVILNAERRAWGIWVAGSGLLLGGVFFVSHTAILGQGLDYVSRGMTFWWLVGWLPVVALPLSWYLVMLWYAGFWDDRRGPLRRRQRPWLYLVLALGAGVIGLLLFANPFPTYTEVAKLALAPTPTLAGIPLLIVVYPLYIVLCIGLSLGVLRRPGPSSRLMGDLARRRARPWLMGTAIILLLISLLVAGAMLWITFNARQRALFGIYNEMQMGIAWFDLIISSLIALATILLGQAIVSYEVFTGKTLPRRGLQRYWRNAVILAAGYSIIVGGSLAISLRPIYALLLTTVMVSIFFALFSWRSYADREQFISRLRPFVTSQDLYESLLTSPSSAESSADAGVLLRALCEDVLDTRLAYLAGVGPLAPLVGTPSVYPAEHPIALSSLAEITERAHSPETICLPLDPGDYAGALWAVPLWSERGLIGVLLLGEKHDEGVYTREEIEIARTAGERLIDTLASSEMAHRLMALQRQRLAESQLLDQRTRRALHDDVLPLVHTALLSLGRQSGNSSSTEAIVTLTDAHRYISDLLREMPATGAPALAGEGLVGALRQTVEEMKDAFGTVIWQIEPAVERAVETLSAMTEEVLYYAAREAIRNAARHGRSEGREHRLNLRIVVAWHDGLEILIEDDGVGMEVATAALDAGQGLALHSTMMAVGGGSLEVDSVAGAYTRVTLRLPNGVGLENSP